MSFGDGDLIPADDDRVCSTWDFISLLLSLAIVDDDGVDTVDTPSVISLWVSFGRWNGEDGVNDSTSITTSPSNRSTASLVSISCLSNGILSRLCEVLKSGRNVVSDTLNVL